MNLKHLKKLAMVSAVALSAAYTGTLSAAPYTIDTALTVAVTATVDNLIEVVTTPIAFGTIGATYHATDIATLAMAADLAGTLTDDQGGGYASADPAAIVASTTTATSGTITITDTIPNADVYLTYVNFVDLDGPGAESFTLSRVVDSVGSDSDGGPVGPTNVIGMGSANGAGTVPVIYVGAEISTETNVASTNGTAYTDGAYAGSFDVYISY